MATAEFSIFAGILSVALSQPRLSGFEIFEYVNPIWGSTYNAVFILVLKVIIIHQTK